MMQDENQAQGKMFKAASTDVILLAKNTGVVPLIEVPMERDSCNAHARSPAGASLLRALHALVQPSRMAKPNRRLRSILRQNPTRVRRRATKTCIARAFTWAILSEGFQRSCEGGLPT